MWRTALASLVLALFACAPSADVGSTLHEIQRLHDADRAATLSGDPNALEKLWTLDAWRAEPGNPAEIGLATIHAHDVQGASARRPGTGILDYRATITDLRVFGDVAIERGYFDVSVRREPNGAPIHFRANLLRVLRRQSDGSWRFSHVAWNPTSEAD
jgi:ketosteroid isomerase-like protein